MPASYRASSNAISTRGCGQARRMRTEDVAYQAVTVAAILTVLGSLWLF